MTVHFTQRSLLVGELNPYGVDPRFALYPGPAGSAGHRLCEKVLDLTPKQYIGLFDRVNLCSSKWSVAEARREAEHILSENRWPVIVLLGRKVSTAFGLGDSVPFTVRTLGDRKVAILPHPSGRCREWNDPSSFVNARTVLRTAGALPGIGEVAS
jgi:hypothetical protein